MEGLGSRGPDIPGTTLYAASKAAVARFTRVLEKDAAGGPVLVGSLSPGMVITELFTGPDESAMSADAKRMANIMADRVEAVAPYLARRVLANTRHGARIDWLNGAKIGWRFATAAFRKNRHFTLD
jgi:NADP-dependent 3-hydroxy acid dehydrogenase YdfG